jgi:hypothetical protein
MKVKYWSTNIWRSSTRAVVIVSAVSVLAVGVTYANLGDAAHILGTSASSGKARLRISSSSSTEWFNSVSANRLRFSAHGYIPGQHISKTLTLQNSGTVALDLRLEVSGGHIWPHAAVAPDDVHIDVFDKSSGTTNHFSLADLSGSGAPLSISPLPLNPGYSERTFKITFFIDPDDIADGTEKFVLHAYDFRFTGALHH